VQAVVHAPETVATRAEALGQRLQPVFEPLPAVFKSLAEQTRPMQEMLW
jgi:hypothetical protein